MSNYADKGEVTREFYRRQGEQREQQRILDLLGSKEYAYSELLRQRPNRKNDAELHAIARTYQAAIALIKGENK